MEVQDLYDKAMFSYTKNGNSWYKIEIIHNLKFVTVQPSGNYNFSVAFENKSLTLFDMKFTHSFWRFIIILY